MNLDEQDSITWTVIQAILMRDWDAASALVKSLDYLGSKPVYGKTILHAAAFLGDEEDRPSECQIDFVHLLRNHKNFDPTITCDCFQTAAQYAFEIGNFDVAELLMLPAPQP